MVQEYVQIKELIKHDVTINLHFTRNNESVYTRYKTDLLWPITPTCRNAQDKSTPRIKTTINSWQLPRKRQKKTTLYFHTWFHARTTIAGKNKLAKQTEQHVITKKSKAREGPDNRPVKRSFRKGNCCFQPDFSTLPRGLGLFPVLKRNKTRKKRGRIAD